MNIPLQSRAEILILIDEIKSLTEQKGSISLQIAIKLQKLHGFYESENSKNDFFKFCSDEWGYCKRSINRLLRAAEFAQKINSSNLKAPKTEAQLRVLLNETFNLSETDKLQIWEQITTQTDDPTLLEIKNTINNFLSQKKLHNVIKLIIELFNL